MRTSDTPGWPPPKCPHERLPDLALAGLPCPLCLHLYQEVFRPISPQPLSRLGFHLTHDLHNGARGLKVRGGLEAVVGSDLLLHLQESSGEDQEEEVVLHPQAGEGGEEEGNRSLPVPLVEVVAGEALTLGRGKTREAAVRVEVEVAPKAVVEAEEEEEEEEVEEERRGGGAWTLGEVGRVSRAGAVVGKVVVEAGALETTGEEALMGSPGQLGRRGRAHERK